MEHKLLFADDYQIIISTQSEQPGISDGIQVLNFVDEPQVALLEQMLEVSSPKGQLCFP